MKGRSEMVKDFNFVPFINRKQVIRSIPGLDFRKGDSDDRNQGKLLPVLSNQKTNNYLKEIAEICGKKLLFTLPGTLLLQQ